MSNARKLADNLPSVGQLSGRNMIINGAMRVNQRSDNSTAYGIKTVDRFSFNNSGLDDAAITQSRSNQAPAGFKNSYKITINTIENSVANTEWLYCRYTMEAQDAQRLNFGSSNAKQTTLSFYVKSSITGTYSVLFFLQDSGRGITRTYTIDSADTWEYKTLTFDGDTGSTINDDKGQGPDFYWTLAAGTDRKSSDSTSWGTYTAATAAYGQTANVAGTASATWNITGVQFEVGSQATPFEHESVADTLLKCQRYFYRNDGNTEYIAQLYSTTSADFSIFTPVFMRATPALTCEDTQNTANKISIYSNGYQHGQTVAVNTGRSKGNSMLLRITGLSSAGSVNDCIQCQFNDVQLDAEF